MQPQDFVFLFCISAVILAAGGSVAYTLLVQRRAINKVDESMELSRENAKNQREALVLLKRVVETQEVGNQFLREILEALREDRSSTKPN
ncbi:MAG TPA: hypothetical protein PLC98_24125 [Anaerolineales bacterium]|nr:hypothetical protein [Anaerolineales bacterium]